MLDMVGKDVLELVSTVNGLSKVRDVRCCFCRGLEECLHGSCCQSSRFGSGRFNGVARAFGGHRRASNENGALHCQNSAIPNDLGAASSVIAIMIRISRRHRNTVKRRAEP